MSSFVPAQTLPSRRRVDVIGAGPVGLFLSALLQPIEGLTVRLFEKRPHYTRTRMVRLASYVAEGSPESYRTDRIDGENIEAVFEPQEIEANLAFRRTIPVDLMSRLFAWTKGFCPLRTIEQSLSELIDDRVSTPVERLAATVSIEDVFAMQEPGDIVVDCTGCKALLRDHLVPGSEATGGGANTVNLTIEYALVVTFLYGQEYACDEFCKYYKNIENAHYKFIPSVDRTFYDRRISHVTGIINITAEEYEVMPQQFDGKWLRENFPAVAQSMDRFIDKIKDETHGEIVGDLNILRIPLNLYHARNYTSRKLLGSDHPFAKSPVFLTGDSAIGSPYFQSITLGFESAMFLAGLLSHSQMPITEMLDRYETFSYKQWLRVYMRSKMIKHNKDLFELVDNPLALLEKLHIY